MDRIYLSPHAGQILIGNEHDLLKPEIVLEAFPETISLNSPCLEPSKRKTH